VNAVAAVATSAPWRWTRRSAPWIGLLLIAVIVSLAAWDIVRGHRLAVEDTGRELETQARIVAEQTARSVQAVDVTLRHVAEQHRQGRLSALSPPQLGEYLRQQAVGLVQADGLVLIDGQGRRIGTSAALTLDERAAHVGELDAFTTLRDNAGLPVFVGDAHRSALDGRWVFAIARRIESAGGEFAGIVLARGRVEYFQSFYRDIQIDPGTKTTLMHRNGRLLARHPQVESALGQHFPLLDGMLALRKSRPTEPIRIESPVDGVERFGALALVPEYPLVTIVTRDVNVALASWRAQSLGTVGRTLALAALAALLLAILQRQIARLDKARASLEATRERFSLAVAGSDDGIWDWDQTTRRIFLSPRARELFGRPGPESEPMDDWFANLQIHPDDAPRRQEALDAHLDGRAPHYESEYRVLHPDGQYRWVRVRGLCVRDAQGRPTRMAGSVSDIDMRKRAEQELRQSEQRYALAMSGLRGGHWVWEIDSDALFVSGTLNELFGLPPDTQPATRAEYFSHITLHPDDRERVMKVGDEIIGAGGSRADFEYRIVLRDSGEVRWIMTRAQCFRNAAGKPVRVAGVSVDTTDRKRTEDALRKSEERFALAVAGSDDGVWDWDFVAGLAFESARARELQGLPPGPEVMPLDDLLESLRVHPEDAPRRAAGIRAHLAGETPAYECEYRVRHDDGVYRWIRVRALCIRDAGGQPVRMAGSVSDIDTRKRAEEALRESEERFALAVASTNDGIIDWDLVGDRIYTSDRAMHICGVVADGNTRTCGQWRALVKFHPDDAQRHLDDLDDHLEGRPLKHRGEYRVMHPDGQYRWVRFRGIVVRDDEGRAVRWAGSVSDIDAQRRAEEALRRSEERYQLAVAGSNEGLWDWDLVADTLFLSARAQLQVQASAGEPLRPRREWIEMTEYHPDDLDRIRRAISAHLHGQTRHFEVEYRIRHHGGQWHWYRQRGVALRDETGRPYRMAGSMEDITDRKAAEAERDRLEQQLRQSQKLEAMGTLAGGIAHDFNNILAAILGYGEMAQKDAPEGTTLRRHIDAALSAAMRARSLVERILAFSRSGMGERVPVHVRAVVSEALDVVLASLPAGVRLERDLACGDAAVLGDATQIHQVVMNLCANAVQAMGSAGTLGVEAKKVTLDAPLGVTTCRLPEGSYVRLVVRDTGVGIAPRVLERIFDPFFTTKEIGVGTGLGLSLVHGIVTDLGGGIDVQSTPGAGTTLTVYLPWSSCIAEPAVVEEPVVEGGGETVLLVDDEEALVRLGEEMMAEIGYEPVGFASSTAALATFRAEPSRFDIVLSDESMPEMTGSELAREIRKIRPDIPIVLMTGHVTPALSARAREAGVAEVLAKPLVSREIARSLAAALRA